MKDELRTLPSLVGPFDNFDIDAASDDPTLLFRQWLSDAICKVIPEPHAMTLSTVDALGWPDARIVILKDVDERGWHFATSELSAKGQQLEIIPRAALTFYWQPLGRQVRLRGPVSALSKATGNSDFATRSVDARAVAMAGRQSAAMYPNEKPDETFDERRRYVEDNPSAVLESWTVYAVNPVEVEFWQASERRRHLRLRYRRTHADVPWCRERLWP